KELREENKRLHTENKRLHKENKRLHKENKRISEELTHVQKEASALRWRIEELEGGEGEENEPEREVTCVVKPSLTGKKKRPGRKPGFKGISRRIPDHVDEVIDVEVETCPHCGTPLGREVEVVERYVEDYKPTRSHVTKYRVRRYWCPKCRKKVHPTPRDVIPKCMLGLHVMVFIAYQRCALRLPYAKIRENVMECLGIKVTDATIYNAVDIISRFYREEYDKIKEDIRKSEAVYTDETGWRKNGINVWLWAFAAEKAVLYKVDERRSSHVPKEVLGTDFRGVVIADFYPAYDKLPYEQQKCLVHLLRDSKEISEQNKETKRFSRRIKRFVKDAAHFKKEPHSLNEITEAKRRFEKRIDRIIGEPYS
ncbi:IS66 family transposase, partial [bacterium]